jgi:hypothetical protein
VGKEPPQNAPLTLIRASKSRGGDHWSPDDYDVRDDAGRVVGRIMLHPQAPKDQPWFWTIVEGIPHSIHNRGYAVSREQAMADFKARGRVEPSKRRDNRTHQPRHRLRSMSVVAPIVLQKSFCTGDQKFCGPQARLSCKHVRDRNASR